MKHTPSTSPTRRRWLALFLIVIVLHFNNIVHYCKGNPIPIHHNDLKSKFSSSIPVNNNAFLYYPTLSKKYFTEFTKGLYSMNVNNNQKTKAFTSLNNEIIESKSPFHRTIITNFTIHKDDRTNEIYYKTHAIAKSNLSYKDHSFLLNYYKKYNNNMKFQTSDPMPPDHVRNWVPTYIGSTKLNSKVLQWKGSCFQNNSVKITKIDKEKKSITIQFDVSNATSTFCYDWYFITTRQNYYVKLIYFKGQHEYQFEKFEEGEWQDVLNNGLRIFEFKDHVFQTLIDAFNAIKILDGIYFEKDKIHFLKKDMGFEFNERPIQQIWIDENDLQSGDLVGQLTFSGLDCLLMYGTGGRIGHIAMILKMDGVTYVIESQDTGIQKTPWKQWYNQYKDESIIVISRLKEEYKSKMNEAKAIEFFKSVEGNEYGFNNIAYAWIDTLYNNYPTMIGATLVLFSNWYMGDYINLLFLKGLNQRFTHYYGVNANCTHMNCVFDILTNLNLTVNEVLALPERDGWLYSNNKPQMVCSVFAMTLFKKAGIFGNLTNYFEAAEFTPKDVYMLDIWDKDWVQPKGCKANPNDDYPFCQLTGKYYWPIKDFATIKPYPKMNERCGAQPMGYKREPDFC
ncbi:hypothetical protein ABK040_005492 [Willaertia magna]